MKAKKILIPIALLIFIMVVFLISQMISFWGWQTADSSTTRFEAALKMKSDDLSIISINSWRRVGFNEIEIRRSDGETEVYDVEDIVIIEQHRKETTIG